MQHNPAPVVSPQYMSRTGSCMERGVCWAVSQAVTGAGPIIAVCWTWWLIRGKGLRGPFTRCILDTVRAWQAVYLPNQGVHPWQRRYNPVKVRFAASRSL
jgi:hypothetical protein